MKGFFEYRSVFLAMAVSATLVIASCKDKPDPDEKVYDRAALAANYADNLIVPGYSALSNTVDSLDQLTAAFISSPDSLALTALRNQLKVARLAWNRVSSFEFGPGATNILRQALNTFPTDANQIQLNITAGTWDLNIASNLDARGYPAIEFLLHGDSLQGILAKFSSAPDAANRKSYLAALVTDIKTLLNNVQGSWTTYGATFKGMTGTDAGSATSMIVNQFTYDIEILKNARIGIPLGKTTLGTPVPGHVESRYAGYSIELAVAQALALKDVFQGKSAAGVDGFGLDDALDAVDAQYNGQPLSTAITNQFDVVVNKLNAIPEPLDQTVVSNAAVVDAAYVEIQRLVVMTKTDMASNLGILITYTDNDGD